MATKKIFHAIDEAIFRQIDLLKQSQSYQQLSEPLNALSETGAKIANQMLSFVYIASPIIGLLVLLIMNYQDRKDLKIREQSLKEIKSFIDESSKLTALEKSIASKTPATPESLSELIKAIATRANVRVGKVNTAEEASKSNPVEGSPSKLVSIRFKITFEDLTAQEISSFLDKLENEEAIKIEKTTIERNPETTRLKGSLNAIHIGVL